MLPLVFLQFLGEKITATTSTSCPHQKVFQGLKPLTLPTAEGGRYCYISHAKNEEIVAKNSQVI